MLVTIREKEYEYISTFPQGWKFAAGDHFIYPVNFGTHKCFIKRFERNRLEKISGWQLLKMIQGKYKPNLPRVHQIVDVKENGRLVYYIFFEFSEGKTLEEVNFKEERIDLKRLNDDLLVL